MTRLTRAMMALAVLSLTACQATLGQNDNSDVTLTAIPNPAPASSSSGVFYTVTDDTLQHQYTWQTSFTVSLQENQGVGVAISSVSVRVQQASAGIVIVPTGGVEHYQFTSQASGNRLEARATASMGFEVLYDLPNRGREALVTVTFAFVDDNNLSFSKSVQVRVQ